MKARLDTLLVARNYCIVGHTHDDDGVSLLWRGKAFGPHHALLQAGLAIELRRGEIVRLDLHYQLRDSSATVRVLDEAQMTKPPGAVH